MGVALSDEWANTRTEIQVWDCQAEYNLLERQKMRKNEILFSFPVLFFWCVSVVFFNFIRKLSEDDTWFCLKASLNQASVKKTIRVVQWNRLLCTLGITP